MKTRIRQTKLFVFAAATACALLTATTHAQETIVNWDRIEGIHPNPTGGQTLAGINPVTFPWSNERGRARLNTSNGRLHFEVQGLSIGASPTPLAVVGTTGVVTELMGTVLCSSTGEYVDSQAVELSADGDASFQGTLPYIFACDDESWVFLLRVSGIVPGAPPITGRWLAHGAARTFRQTAKNQQVD
jgi:hypothetical protein